MEALKCCAIGALRFSHLAVSRSQSRPLPLRFSATWKVEVSNCSHSSTSAALFACRPPHFFRREAALSGHQPNTQRACPTRRTAAQHPSWEYIGVLKAPPSGRLRIGAEATRRASFNSIWIAYIARRAARCPSFRRKPDAKLRPNFRPDSSSPPKFGGLKLRPKLTPEAQNRAPKTKVHFFEN